MICNELNGPQQTPLQVNKELIGNQIAPAAAFALSEFGGASGAIAVVWLDDMGARPWPSRAASSEILSKKTVVGEDGAMEIEVPRDRSGSFEPLLIAKGQKRFEGFDEKIIAMYARGMTVREIQSFLLDQYKVEVSADFISTVTDSVWDAVVEWQNRPLERAIRWSTSTRCG